MSVDGSKSSQSSKHNSPAP
jgi:DNA topoisomerase-1